MTYLTPRFKAVLVSSVGGGLEMYDFTIYIFFAPIFASLFFPEHNHFISLLETLSVFAIGYFARPLGAVVFGCLGDKLGRKQGMLVTIIIMAIATVSIGLLPTYETIGIAAPILLIILRFTQGFAVGGDLPGAITFVAEYADDKKRGLYCSFVYCAVNLGLLLASLVGSLFTISLSYEHLISWGWRVAFLLGVLIGFLGFYLRRKIVETPYFERLEQAQIISNNPLKNLIQVHLKQVLHGIGLVWFYAVILSQIFLYMPTYFRTINHMDLSQALLLNSFNILILSCLIPIAGYISDKVGRKPVIFITALLVTIFSYPLYTLLASPDLILEIFALLCFSIMAASIIGTVPATLAEMFSTQVRYSGVAISYNIGFAIFAGLTPLIATYLLYQFNIPEAPSFNLIVSAIVALITTRLIDEGSQKSLS